MEKYYLQDSRTYIGNDVVWWAKDSKGYTTDLSKAAVYTKEAAEVQHRMRETDIPWLKDYIDQKVRPTVDMQYISRKEGLKGSGIKLIKPKKPKKAQLRCESCGCFMSETQLWVTHCPKCGTDNRP